MSESDQESVNCGAKSYSSEEGSSIDYEDEVLSEDEDDISLNNSEDGSAAGFFEMEFDGAKIVQDKRLLEKLNEEENMKPVAKKDRCTVDFITKYEYARIIGMRASQIANNSPLYLDDPIETLKGLSAIQIAEREYKAKKLPYIIRRPLPNGTYEDWPLYELSDKNL